MPTRKTSVSRTVEYEISECVQCDEVVFTDADLDNVDDLPEGVPVVLAGGGSIRVSKTDDLKATIKNQIPEVVVDLLGLEKTTGFKQSYLCPSCAESVYDFNTEL